MRTIAQETASQVGLRNCSEDVGGRSLLHMILVKGALAVKHIFWQRLAASHAEHVSSLMIVPLF